MFCDLPRYVCNITYFISFGASGEETAVQTKAYQILFQEALSWLVWQILLLNNGFRSTSLPKSNQTNITCFPSSAMLSCTLTCNINYTSNIYFCFLLEKRAKLSGKLEQVSNRLVTLPNYQPFELGNICGRSLKNWIIAFDSWMANTNFVFLNC